MKRTILFFLLAALVLTAAGCAGKPEAAAGPDASSPPEGAVFENQGRKLRVPAEYADLVIVKTDEPDLLFSVYEKASVEAAARSGGENTGEGWLFGISRVGEQRLHELLCGDMSGMDVFAAEGDGSAYLHCHPTDVRLFRDGENAYGEEDLAAWSYVNDWVPKALDQFIEDNSLLPCRRSNTGLDMALCRILYRGDTDYELLSLSHGAFGPGSVDPTPYLEALTALTYEYAGDAEAPDGEYIVLRTGEDERFDFFLGGDGSYVREVRGEYETLYRASNGADVTSPVRDWYDALAAAGGKADYDRDAYRDAAQKVLDEFAALDPESFEEAAHPELPWYTAAIANTARNDLFYGYYDFDGNDVPELIIAAGDDGTQVPEAVYAFDGAKMVYLCKDQPLGERSYLSWNGDLFVVRASGGAAVGSLALYRIADDGFGTDLLEIMDYEYRDEDTVIYTPELGKMTPEEFAALDLPQSFDAPVKYERFASRKDGQSLGMVNPWSEAETAELAAQGAGLDSFTIPSVYSCFADEPTAMFLYMDGTAEAILDSADHHMLLRKGVGDGDISGDYGVYEAEWDVNWKGLTIHCRGENDSVRTAWWSFGGNAFSLSFNAGDSDLPGLSEADLCSLVNQIQ